MRRDSGLILEPLIWLFCMGAGSFMATPQIVRLMRHEPLPWWRWTLLVVGGVFVLIPLLGILQAFLDGLRKKD